jgi:hypothetical protein
LGLRAWHERRWVDVPPLSLGERTLAPA